MITQLGLSEGQNGGRKEHSFVVRVRDEQTDALVIETREVARKGGR